VPLAIPAGVWEDSAAASSSARDFRIQQAFKNSLTNCSAYVRTFVVSIVGRSKTVSPRSPVQLLISAVELLVDVGM